MSNFKKLRVWLRSKSLAKGSAAELFTQLTIAEEIGYLSKDIANKLTKDCEDISGMLYRLIQSRC